MGAAAPEDSKQRPWVAKLGAWYHNGGFDDQRGDPGIYFAEPTSTNTSVDPLANGSVPRKPNNYGLYTVGEVTLWRGETSNLASFARLSFTPGGRNLFDFYGDAGLAWHGPFGRKDDTASIGLAYAQTGAAGRYLDRALRALTGLPPTRNREMVRGELRGRRHRPPRDPARRAVDLPPRCRHPGRALPRRCAAA